MKKVLILGGNSRETIFALKLSEIGYDVYVMSEFPNINITQNPSVKYYKSKFDEIIIKQIKPDLIFAFNEEYVFDEKLNTKLHELLPKKNCVCIPTIQSIFLEQDKLKVKRIMNNGSKNEMISISNKKDMENILNSYNKLFVRILKDNNIEFRICSKKDNNINFDYKNSIVLVEPYIEGDNATITYFIKNGKVSILPIVFDYPYFIEKDVFIKTSGIMCEYDYRKVIKFNLVEVATNLIKDIMKIIPNNYCGFLATQILFTKNNYYFVEFDIKPGEPEFINVLNSMDENLNNILNNEKEIYISKMKKNYSISVALANTNYPKKGSVEIENFEQLLKNKECRILL